MSSARLCPRSATFTFAVVQPGNRTRIASTSSARTAGTVAFTSMRSRRAAGCSRHPKSRAAASHGAASASSYSTNGENSLAPSGASNTTASRTEMPRKRVRVGIATTCAAAMISSRAGGRAGVMPRSCHVGLRARPRARRGAGPRSPRPHRCARLRSDVLRSRTRAASAPSAEPRTVHTLAEPQYPHRCDDETRHGRCRPKLPAPRAS